MHGGWGELTTAGWMDGQQWCCCCWHLACQDHLRTSATPCPGGFQPQLVTNSPLLLLLLCVCVSCVCCLSTRRCAHVTSCGAVHYRPGQARPRCLAAAATAPSSGVSLRGALVPEPHAVGSPAVLPSPAAASGVTHGCCSTGASNSPWCSRINSSRSTAVPP